MPPSRGIKSGCAPAGELNETVAVAALYPTVVGVKITENEQVPPGAIVLPAVQLSGLMKNSPASAPESKIESVVIDPLVSLVIMNVAVLGFPGVNSLK